MSNKSGALHENILDAPRQLVFEKLGKYKHIGYLAGGTALALQLGHRHSYDFDVFCDKQITDQFIQNVRSDFQIGQVLLNSKDEFTFITRKGIKITFLYYPFSFPGRLIQTNSLSLLAPLNIAASKAYTLNRRAFYRDYVDIFFLLREKNIALREIIIRAKKVYRELFSEKLFLGQLVYHKDLDAADKKAVQYIGKHIAQRTIFTELWNEVEIYQKKYIK